MLTRIFIQNFALIDSLELELTGGLQVITGETGAGKSIILGALRLILGERADVKSIQQAEKKSIVEAEFKVAESFRDFFEENDLDFSTSTIIRREILLSGKSRAFVNDVPVTLEMLRLLSSQLIDIHSQFETSNLFTQEYQFRIIDGLAGHSKELEKYRTHYRDFQKLQAALNQYRADLAEGNREADYRKFLLNELEEAALDDLDMDELQDRLATQENAEAISENLAQVLARIDQDEIGVLDHLNEIRAKLAKTAELSHHFSAISSRFETSFLEFKDFTFELQSEAEKMEVDPEQLNTLNSVINNVNALLLKHNATSVAELIAIRDDLAGKQDTFENLKSTIAAAEKELIAAEEELNSSALQISKSRRKAIPQFTKKMESLFRNLGLEKGKLEVELTPAGGYNLFGNENIAILFQANSGFPLKPIQNAISGGERSRVMLAVKKIMAENTALPTLILDEIDTGVSGKVADEMGKMMKEMAADLQLIVITHLAQVAAKGSRNYKVVKKEVDGKTQSAINTLNDEEKLQEIAQLLSGASVTEAARLQAQELMK